MKTAENDKTHLVPLAEEAARKTNSALPGSSSPSSFTISTGSVLRSGNSQYWQVTNSKLSLE